MNRYIVRSGKKRLSAMEEETLFERLSRERNITVEEMRASYIGSH